MKINTLLIAAFILSMAPMHHLSAMRHITVLGVKKNATKKSSAQPSKKPIKPSIPAKSATKSLMQKIVRIKALNQIILPRLDKKCLIAFDIDKTLLRYGHTGPVAVEQQSTRNFVARVQKSAQTMALTAAPVGKLRPGNKIANEDKRHLDLKAVGIDFKHCWRMNRIFPKLTASLKGQTQTPLFKHGILMTGELRTGSFKRPAQSKGTVLEAFLKQKGWLPRLIILLDDKIENLRSVSAMCRKNKIQFTGYWYGRIAFS